MHEGRLWVAGPGLGTLCQTVGLSFGLTDKLLEAETSEMAPTETKIEYIVRAKAILREDLRAQSWPEKVRAIERMNAAMKIAQQAMRETLARENDADTEVAE